MEPSTDYIALIEQLRRVDTLYAGGSLEHSSLGKEAATAIETLLEERDAAVNDINELLKAVDEQACTYCVWQGHCPQEFCSCAKNAKRRGVQKGAQNENYPGIL